MAEIAKKGIIASVKRIYMKKKQPFILFEILLSLAILAISLPFLMRIPSHLLLKESRSMERIELQRDADRAFATIKSRLYANDIPIKDLLDKPSVLEEGQIAIPWKGREPKRFYRTVKIGFVKKRKEEVKFQEHLFELQVIYKRKNGAREHLFSYTIFISESGKKLDGNIKR